MKNKMITSLFTVLLIGSGAASEAGSSKRVDGKPQRSGKASSSQPKFTPGMWAMAKAKYQKDTAHLNAKTASNPPPVPQFSPPQTGTPGPGGTVTIATPPVIKRSNSNYSMTANRGRRDSTTSRRSISSDSTVSSASGFSSDG